MLHPQMLKKGEGKEVFAVCPPESPTRGRHQGRQSASSRPPPIMNARVAPTIMSSRQRQGPVAATPAWTHVRTQYESQDVQQACAVRALEEANRARAEQLKSLTETLGIMDRNDSLRDEVEALRRRTLQEMIQYSSCSVIGPEAVACKATSIAIACKA